MRRLGLALSALIAVLGIIGLALFLASLPGILNGDTDGLLYLIVILPTVYASTLFIKLLKNTDFHTTHRLTLQLLLWPIILSVIVALYFVIMAFATGEGLALFGAILSVVLGMAVATVLSFTGYLLDATRKKA